MPAMTYWDEAEQRYRYLVGPQGPPGPGYDGNPIGSILTFSGQELPFGYVLADGSTYAADEYPQGYNFAVAESQAGNVLWTTDTGARTFTVPDLRDRFLYSASSGNLGDTDGEANHLLTVAEMPSHNHGGATGTGTSGAMSANASHTHGLTQVKYAMYQQAAGAVSTMTGSGTAITQVTDAANLAHTHSVPALAITAQGGGGAHNNMPPYVVVALLVKVAGITIDPETEIVQGPPGPPGSDAQVAGSVLELLTTGTERKVAFGSFNAVFANSQTMTSTTVTHNLGVVPQVVLCMAGQAITPVFYSALASLTATTMVIGGWSGAALNGTWMAYWLVIG